MKTRILSLLAIAALAVAACGGPTATPVPSGPPASPTFSAVPSEALTPAPHTTAAPKRTPRPDTSAMEALDYLDSYKFSWALAPDANPNAGNSTAGHGIVVNNLTQENLYDDGWHTDSAWAMWYTDGALFTVSVLHVGVWSSRDGTTWTGPVMGVSGVPPVSIGPYGWQFGGVFPHVYRSTLSTTRGSVATGGTQTKNGIDCLHYKIDSQTDLWVAVDGGYAVSGLRDDGNANYSFDITHVNDPSNKVSPPTNVVATPT